MKIEISYADGKIQVSNSSARGIPAELTPLEIEAVGKLLPLVLSEMTIAPFISFDRRSSNYLTVALAEKYDFLRIKRTAKTFWFSVSPAPEDKSNLLFANVSNKRLLHWKINVTDVNAAELYQEIIYHSALNAKSWYDKEK